MFTADPIALTNNTPATVAIPTDLGIAAKAQVVNESPMAVRITGIPQSLYIPANGNAEIDLHGSAASLTATPFGPANSTGWLLVTWIGSQESSADVSSGGGGTVGVTGDVGVNGPVSTLVDEQVIVMGPILPATNLPSSVTTNFPLPAGSTGFTNLLIFGKSGGANGGGTLEVLGGTTGFLYYVGPFASRQTTAPLLVPFSAALEPGGVNLLFTPYQGNGALSVSIVGRIEAAIVRPVTQSGTNGPTQTALADPASGSTYTLLTPGAGVTVRLWGIAYSDTVIATAATFSALQTVINGTTKTLLRTAGGANPVGTNFPMCLELPGGLPIICVTAADVIQLVSGTSKLTICSIFYSLE